MKWNEIEKACGSKRVIIYGLGLGIRQFMDAYGNTIAVEAVIDNDPAKQGKKAGDLLAEAFGTKCEDIGISDANILTEYAPEDTLILVASAKRYAEILRDLERQKFDRIYVISLLDGFVQEPESVQENLQKQHGYARHCSSLPIVPKKIILSSFANYADHEKYISEALMELRTDLDIVWLVDDLNATLSDKVRKVLKTNWKKVLYEAETAKMWIADLPVPELWIKRPQQIYIQTKHWASITLKKFYLDAVTFQDELDKLASWNKEREIIDYIIVGSEFDKESCRRGFGIERGFITAGSPRSDGVFRERENREKVYSEYKLAEDVHVLIYAPTYRFSKEKGKSVHQSREIGFGYEQVKTALEKRFGGGWMIALRLHPSVKEAVKEMKLPDFVFDVSSYEDSEELVSAFDITVSDYSSLMFEPAFIKKPVFLFATDLKNYLANEYELLIPYRELPFDIAEDIEQLCANILQFDKGTYEKKLDDFWQKYGVKEDGHASKRAAEFISALL